MTTPRRQGRERGPIPAMQLFAEHVERFNRAVETGDFGPMVAAFAEDADMVFEGVPAGPFHGRGEIAAAYREQPPDDVIEVLSAELRGPDEVIARYRWSKGGLGSMRLTRTPAGEIGRLVVTFDPSP